MANDYERRQRSRRQRRRKRNKKRLNNSTIIILIIGFLIALLLLYAIFNLTKKLFSDEFNVVETIEKVDETNLDSKDKLSTNSIENTNEIIQSIIEDKKIPSDIIKRNVDSFIDVNNLDSEKINIIYTSKDDTYIKDKNIRVPMRDYNLFIISMIFEELEDKGQVDLNKIVDLNKYYDEKVEDKPISVLIKDMIIRPDEEGVLALTETIKEIKNIEWKKFANARYSIDISDDNTMTLEDVSKLLQLLISKENGEFKYKDTISYMKEATKLRSDIDLVNETEFIGIEGAILYEYSIESAFVLGENPYIYVIYAQYSDVSVLEEIRNIIITANK